MRRTVIRLAHQQNPFVVIAPLRLFYRIAEKQILNLHVMRCEKLFHLDELTGREK
jgi:hypothetical protein